jgi:hypothetical protein
MSCVSSSTATPHANPRRSARRCLALPAARTATSLPTLAARRRRPAPPPQPYGGQSSGSPTQAAAAPRLPTG